MKAVYVLIMSLQDASAWLKQRDLKQEMFDSSERAPNSALVYGLPLDTCKKARLAHLVMDTLDFTESVVLWISGYGIWPSCEHRDLFDGYRSSIGESRPLHEAPVHIFEMDDRMKFKSILLVSLYFLWDADIVSISGHIRIRFSHDEYFSLWGAEMELTKLQTAIASLELKAL